MKLFLDTETYCETPIAYGTHRYAEDAELMLFAWAFDDEPAQVVDPTAGEAIPQRVLRAFKDPAVELWAHNSHFDRTILKRQFPEVADPARWRDTMILAYAHSLPGALGTLCPLLGIPEDQAKDKDGHRLVLLFCKPQPAYRKIRRHTRLTDPEDWAHFKEYCRRDVGSMYEVWKRLPHWNEKSFPLWREWTLDQRINDRGMQIDMDLVHAAIEASTAAKASADRRVHEMTSGQVSTTGQRDEMLGFMLREYGVSLPDMQKATLERRLDDPELPDEVREMIALRLQSTKTSVQKFVALANCSNKDGRLRGCMQYMGAARTGRFSGRLFQPQNLPRGSMKPEEVETAIAALKGGVADLLYSDVMSVVSSCIRGAIIAPPGKKLVVADLSNIEGRVLAWLAGEEWKLKAFRAYDEGTGVDLYKATYGRTFGVRPEDVTKKQRQIGKVLELAMGYQGGVGAFLTFARAYRVDLDELAEHTRKAINPKYWSAAEDSYDWCLKHGGSHGLAKDTYIACDAIKRAWRDAHPAICKFWADVSEACEWMLTAQTPKVVGKCVFGRLSRSFCGVKLPSGRFVCYPMARLPREDERATFVYQGINQYSRKWTDIRTYGGKVVENLTQATARDLLVDSFARVEAAGYRIVFSVHDELITECPDAPEFTADSLAGLMTSGAPWSKGLPLSAAGFEGYRYKKD